MNHICGSWMPNFANKYKVACYLEYCLRIKPAPRAHRAWKRGLTFRARRGLKPWTTANMRVTRSDLHLKLKTEARRSIPVCLKSLAVWPTPISATVLSNINHHLHMNVLVAGTPVSAAAVLATSTGQRSKAATRKWTDDEDELLQKAVLAQDGKNWKAISTALLDRSEVFSRRTYRCCFFDMLKCFFAAGSMPSPMAKGPRPEHR